jgi:hypothetical protein
MGLALSAEQVSGQAQEVRHERLPNL